MNNWIKGALIFAVGAAAGAGCAYLALDKKYEKLLDEQVEDVREHYRKRLLDNWDKVSETVSTKEPKIAEKTNIPKVEYDKLSSDGERNGFIDYTAYSSKDDIVNNRVTSMRDELDRVSKAVHDDDFDEHMAERESPEDDEENDYEQALVENQRIQDEQDRAKNEGIEPYAITRSEYLNQKSWYEKLSWNYYADGIVTDDGDDVIEEPNLFLGHDWAESFGFDGSDPDIAYIRNDQTAHDYEVCRISDPYYQNEIKLSSEE